MNNSLYLKSVEIILKNQAPIGAYIASPNFESYHYSWIRDGSYISYAMDLAQEYRSAEYFHEWVANVVLSRTEVLNTLTTQNASKMIKKGDYLHTRFTMEGKEAREEWPNFQLDGFGTWLWSLSQHTHESKTPLSRKCLQAAGLVARYLCTLWQEPCYDLWEEHPHTVHPYTLACIYGGLKSISQSLESDFSQEAELIKTYILENYCKDGYISKFQNDQMVDASLIGLCVPYNVIAPAHPIMKETIQQIEQQLIQDKGVHRYREDSYFGGGEWILLSAWLGWYYTKVGNPVDAKSMLEWIEEQTDADFNLPEQVPHTLNHPEKFTYWENRWGSIANPLLWSHAKYIILKRNLS